jgi:hypothetical protein
VTYRGDALIYGQRPPSPPSPPSNAGGAAGPGSRVYGRARASRVKVRGTTVRVPLRCIGASEEICRLTLSLRALRKPRIGIARKSVLLSAGHRRVVSLKLSPAGRRLLAKGHGLIAKLRVVQATDKGAAAILAKRIAVRPARAT